MTESVVVHQLSKTYGRARSTRRGGSGLVRAVDGISLTVHPGEIYGFLGPNGAGKTTTLRMLLGLIRPSSGTVSVLGETPGSSAALSRVGALIEGPAFYPYLSGRGNLTVLARYGGWSPASVDRALDLVSLRDRAGDRFSTYSLGMKQRLGVASALLKNPELVVLDEPTNGLDPAGMRDMRRLVRQLGAEGRTVLLSSHLMAEVQQICDRVAVIDRGRIIAESTVEELRGQGELVVSASPSDRARQLLEARPEVRAVRMTDGSLRVQVEDRHTAELARCLVEAGFAVTELRREERQLEDVFMEMTEHRDEMPAPAGETANAREAEVHHV
jgi:ABC-2 type transport system ATP-binding protein